MARGGIRATQPVSISPRRFISTVDAGGQAHQAYIGWTKPVRVLHRQAGYANRQKTELCATQICGPLKQTKDLVVVVPTYLDKTKPKVTLHLPKENVIRGGTSLTKNSPTVVKMDRSFRHTFYGNHGGPYASPRSTQDEGETQRRPVPRHFTDQTIQPMVQSLDGRAQSMLVELPSSDPPWIGDEAPRISLLETHVDSPRIQRLLDEHPNIELDRRPARLPCSLQPQTATLAPYKSNVVPYNPEFLWVHTDPNYKYRALVPLSPRSIRRNGAAPVIPSLRQEKMWNSDNLSRSRDLHAKQMGNPKVLKLECTQNGYFDANVISTSRAEFLYKQQQEAKKVGMDRLLDEGRKEFAALKVRLF